MADQAQKRIAALGQQLTSSVSTGLPPIQRKAGPSNALRVAGKVVIITGTSPTLTPIQHCSNVN